MVVVVMVVVVMMLVMVMMHSVQVWTHFVWRHIIGLQLFAKGSLGGRGGESGRVQQPTSRAGAAELLPRGTLDRTEQREMTRQVGGEGRGRRAGDE